MQDKTVTMLPNRHPLRAHRAVVPIALAGLLLGCGGPSGAPPEKDTPSGTGPTPSSSGSATAPVTAGAGVAAPSPATTGEAAPSATATFKLPKPDIPMLTPVPLKLAGNTSDDRIYPIEGATILVRGLNIGRLVSDGVLWIGKLPSVDPAFAGMVAPSIVNKVRGRWPDRVDVIYTDSPGRAGQARYLPLIGKAREHSMSPGVGRIEDVITVGESTVLVTIPSTNYELVTVRGPEIAVTGQGGGEPGGDAGAAPALPQVYPLAFNGSPAGTLIAVGNFGSQGAPAAWVWSGPGKARILELGQWLTKEDDPYYTRTLLQGAKDEIWLYSGPDRPILRYKDGAFEQVPALDRPLKDVFVSPAGQLHATDGRVISRFEEGKWKAIAELPWPMDHLDLVVRNGVFWSGVTSFREGGGMEARDDCLTPFVYLYEVKDGTPADFTFPDTRKALLSFPDLSGVTLVEFDRSGPHHKLGIKVPGNAQGLEIIKHVKDTMKGEDPRLLCFEPPDPRKIDIRAGDK